MSLSRKQRLREASVRAFTLIELMISLVMGLIVALAAVALAKSSTTTFHEQARMSGVEMTLRSASERLRADLLKASYMSTPNIQLDTTIARIPGHRSTTASRHSPTSRGSTSMLVPASRGPKGPSILPLVSRTTSIQTMSTSLAT